MAITSYSKSDYDRDVKIVENYVQAWVAAGFALLRIRKHSRYEGKFEEWVEERFGIGKSHAYRLMDATKVVSAIATKPVAVEDSDGGPTVEGGGLEKLTERCARELLPLADEPETVAAVWHVVVEETDGNPTSKDVRREVRRRIGDGSEAALRIDPDKEVRVDPLTTESLQAMLQNYNGRSLVEEVYELGNQADKSSIQAWAVAKWWTGPAMRPPTLDEVREHCAERSSTVNAERFYCYYQALGWCDESKTGRRRPIVDWRARLFFWELSDQQRNGPSVDDVLRDTR